MIKLSEFTMISHNHKPQSLWQYACRNEEKHGVTKKGGRGNDSIGSIINQFRQESHKSLDLNYPMLEPGPPSRPCFQWHDFFHEEVKQHGVFLIL
jgi:hypothetical protein